MKQIVKKIFAIFSIRKSMPLKYTEYKHLQALWLQAENEKRIDRGTNIEQFCIKKYWGYLRLIGYENEEVNEKIMFYLKAIGTYHLTGGGSFFDYGHYDKEIADNIDVIMDKILK